MTVFKVKFPANGTSISSVDDMLDFMLGAEFAVAAGVETLAVAAGVVFSPATDEVPQS